MRGIVSILTAFVNTSLGYLIEILHSKTCSKWNNNLPCKISCPPSFPLPPFLSPFLPSFLPPSLPPSPYPPSLSLCFHLLLILLQFFHQSKWYHMLSCSGQKPGSHTWYLFFVTFHIHQFLLILSSRYASICQLLCISFPPTLVQPSFPRLTARSSLQIHSLHTSQRKIYTF